MSIKAVDIFKKPSVGNLDLSNIEHCYLLKTHQEMKEEMLEFLQKKTEGISFSPNLYVEVQKILREKKRRSNYVFEPYILRPINKFEGGLCDVVFHDVKACKQDKGNIYDTAYDMSVWSTIPLVSKYNKDDLILPMLTVKGLGTVFSVRGHAFKRLEENTDITINHSAHFCASAMENQVTYDENGQPWLYIFDAISLDPLGAAPLEYTRVRFGEEKDKREGWTAKTFYSLDMLNKAGGKINLITRPKSPSVFVEKILSMEDTAVFWRDGVLKMNKDEIIGNGIADFFYPFFNRVFYLYAKEFGKLSPQFATERWFQDCVARAEISGNDWELVLEAFKELQSREKRGAIIIYPQPHRHQPGLRWCVETFTDDQRIKEEMYRRLANFQIGRALTRKVQEKVEKVDPRKECVVGIITGKKTEISYWRMNESDIERRCSLNSSMFFKKHVRIKALGEKW